MILTAFDLIQKFHPLQQLQPHLLRNYKKYHSPSLLKSSNNSNPRLLETSNQFPPFSKLGEWNLIKSDYFKCFRHEEQKTIVDTDKTKSSAINTVTLSKF